MLQAENVLFTAVLIGYFALTGLNFVLAIGKNEKLFRIASLLQGGILIHHTLALILRGIGAGRWPMTNQYEFAVSFAWALCLVSLFFIRKYQFPLLGVFSSPLILLMIGYAAMQNREVRELMPSLRSSWLAFHVSTAIIAYGSFGVAMILSLIFLFRGKMKEDRFWGQHVPQPEKLDQISYRSVSLGMLFLTLTMLTGAIWAEQAWGSYWSWDPKETWSLITWIIYAVYLHLRLRKGWQGRAAAWFAVVGFICVIFTYLGVNTFLPGIHSYA